MRKGFTAIVLGAALALGGVACKEEGPAEKAGRQMDEAMDNAKESMNDAMDKAGKAMDDAADQANQAMEDAKKQMQGEN